MNAWHLHSNAIYDAFQSDEIISQIKKKYLPKSKRNSLLNLEEILRPQHSPHLSPAFFVVKRSPATAALCDNS